MSEKKDLAIVFGITKNLDFALATVLIGIQKYFSVQKYDVIVYHDGLEKEKMDFLNNIVKCKFIKYENNLSEKEFNKESLKLYSNMCLARFECFELLKEYKKIIWHDVDILIQKDFAELLNYGNKSGLAMTYTDIGFLTEANFNCEIDGYNMFLPLLNSGIIVFSDILKDFEIMKQWCYDMVKKLNVKLRYTDQGVLNLLVQEFNINVEPIDIEKYCCHPSRKNSKNAAIIHTYGYDKFWNANYLREKFPEWEVFLEEWGRIVRKKYGNSKPENPIISVVMSLYKRTTYFNEALNSILNQTFGNFEIIIVVEYSDEQEKINKLIKKFNDKRIIVVNNEEKLGFAKSLNKGIELASGKYIARMDDDDISLPIRFERQLAYFKEHPDISILGTAVVNFMNDKREIYPTVDSEIIKTYTLINNQMYHPTIMMVREDIIKYNLFYDPEYKTEDAELWSRAVKVVKLANMKEILLKYRVCEENETSIAKQDVFNSDLKIIQKQLKENLRLDLPLSDIIYLSGRISSYGYYYNKEILKKRNKLTKIVYNQNKKIKYYNNDYLRQLLEINKNDFIKRFIKMLLRPIYNRLMYRIDLMVDNKLWNFKNEIL